MPDFGFRTGSYAMDGVNVKAGDAPLFEGIVLVEVSTNLKDLRTAVDAYREALNVRLRRCFNVKPLMLAFTVFSDKY